MKWEFTKSAARRAVLPVLCALALLASHPAHAYTTALFVTLQNQVNNDIANLSAIENPTRTERTLLRSLTRASNVFLKPSQSDGKTLQALNSILGRTAGYEATLSTVTSNLLVTFNTEYTFVGNLLQEVPPSAQATALSAQYSRLSPLASRLNNSPTIAKVAGMYDSTKGRLDAIFDRAVELLIIPFPSDLGQDSVSAKINGVFFRSSAGSASESVYEAVATESNIVVTLSALMTSGAPPATRGIMFSVPNAQFGSFRYPIGGAVTLTNRLGVYSGSEVNVGATNGSIFVSTTATEVYGTFSASGPGFSITDGRFRITFSP